MLDKIISPELAFLASTDARLPIPENWKPIPEVDGYEISDLGRLRSINRIVETSDGRSCFYRGRVRKLAVMPSGEVRMTNLTVSGVPHSVGIAATVLTAFVGPVPHPGWWASHKSENWLDNRVTNLQWASRASVIQASILNQTSNITKLSVTDVHDIRELYKIGVSKAEIAAHYRVHYDHITNILSGARWGFLPARS